MLLCVIFTKVYISLYIAIYNNYTYSAGMKERCRDGCRTSLLIAGVVLVPAIFHTLLPPCHPYITTHFMEMIFSTCLYYTSTLNNTHENVQSTYVPQGSLRQCPITSHMYSFLCLHSAQTLVFCRCMHAECNNNCLENPLGPASGCAMLC